MLLQRAAKVAKEDQYEAIAMRTIIDKLEIPESEIQNDKPMAAVPTFSRGIRLVDLFLDPSIISSLKELITEHRGLHLLADNGIPPRHLTLFHGEDVSGKTLASKALASELRLPHHTLNLRLVESPVQEMIQMLEKARTERGVFLINGLPDPAHEDILPIYETLKELDDLRGIVIFEQPKRFAAKFGSTKDVFNPLKDYFDLCVYFGDPDIAAYISEHLGSNFEYKHGDDWTACLKSYFQDQKEIAIKCDLRLARKFVNHTLRDLFKEPKESLSGEELVQRLIDFMKS